METPDGVLNTPAPPIPLRVDTTKELADARWIGINKSGLKNKGMNTAIASFRDLFIPIILGLSTFNVYAELGHVHDICAKTSIAQFLGPHW